jgi:hypothetical protein
MPFVLAVIALASCSSAEKKAEVRPDKKIRIEQLAQEQDLRNKDLKWITCKWPSDETAKPVDCEPIFKELRSVDKEGTFRRMEENALAVLQEPLQEMKPTPVPKRAFFTIQKPQDMPDIALNPKVRLLSEALPTKDGLYSYMPVSDPSISPLAYLPLLFMGDPIEDFACPWKAKCFKPKNFDYDRSCHQMEIKYGKVVSVMSKEGLEALCGATRELFRPIYDKKQNLLALRVFYEAGSVGTGYFRPHYDQKGRIALIDFHEENGALYSLGALDITGFMTPLWYRFLYSEGGQITKIRVGDDKIQIDEGLKNVTGFPGKIKEMDFIDFSYDADGNLARVRQYMLEQADAEFYDLSWVGSMIDMPSLAHHYPSCMIYSGADGTTSFFESDILSAVFENSFIRMFLPASRHEKAASCFEQMEKGERDGCFVAGPLYYDFVSWKDHKLQSMVLRVGAMAIFIDRAGLRSSMGYEPYLQGGLYNVFSQYQTYSPPSRYDGLLLENVTMEQSGKIARIETCSMAKHEGRVTLEQNFMPEICDEVRSTFFCTLVPQKGDDDFKIEVGLGPTGYPFEVIYSASESSYAPYQRYVLTYSETERLDHVELFDKAGTLQYHDSCDSMTGEEIHKEQERFAAKPQGFCFETNDYAVNVLNPLPSVDEFEYFSLLQGGKKEARCLGQDLAALRYELDEAYSLKSITPYDWECQDTSVKDSDSLFLLWLIGIGDSTAPVGKITFECGKGAIKVMGKCLQGKMKKKTVKQLKCSDEGPLLRKKYELLSEKGSRDAKIAALRDFNYGIYDEKLTEEEEVEILRLFLADPCHEVQCEAAKALMNNDVMVPAMKDVILKPGEEGDFCEANISIRFLKRLLPDLPSAARPLLEHLEQDVNNHEWLEEDGLYNYFSKDK